MAYFVDFHTHSYHSVDATNLPADLVASARDNNPAITHMALSDHNTYSGCPAFLAACRQHGIEGFVSAEISTSHPDFPGMEIHFLTGFGTQWTDAARRRISLFAPHFNAVDRVHAENVFRFIEAAQTLGIRLDYRQVVQRSVAFYHNLPEPRDPTMISPPDFYHVRKILREGDYGEKTTSGRTDIEQRVWKQSGIKPAPTPSIAQLSPIYRQARPAVTLSHPMLYSKTPAEIRPYLREWQREMGLIAIEAHYKNVFYADWKALADELGLLVSPGSDRHHAYVAGDPAASVPVVGEDQADVPALLDMLRAAGG